ncbi:MAG: CoB--CoM heterodisulfide reductase iron-sulfur subunit B family protein, partial [Clostridia bacterium]
VAARVQPHSGDDLRQSEMGYAYFPGCTLRAKAKGFESSALASARALGIHLEELPNWQCCGATFPLQVDNSFPLVSPARTLASARKAGERLVTLCSACYNVLKRTNHVMCTDADRRDKVNAFIEEDYKGDLEVAHFLEVLRDDVGFDALARRAKVPLGGLAAAPYYGCLLLRPADELAFDDPEAPRILEDFLSALGCRVVDHPYKIECCGSYVALDPGEAASEPSRLVVESAKARGAQVIVTSCPLCQYNLEVSQRGPRGRGGAGVPVIYFTQLLAIALGLSEDVLGFEDHVISPGPLLRSIGAMGSEATA